MPRKVTVARLSKHVIRQRNNRTNATTATVSRFLAGSYIGQFPSASEGSTGTEQTTAYGSTPAHCIADGPGGSVGGNQTADVFCFDTSGNPLDITYTMQWMVR